MAAAKNTKKKSLGLEVGDSGTEILNGIVSEEYNTKLRDTQGVKIYDEMRKSDGTVHAAIQAVTLPIRRAKWYVEAGDDDEQSEKIREFVEMALFDWMTITWNDLLRQALLSLPFGVMPFEKVFEMRSFEGGDYITWRKFAPRLPKSIEKWELEDGTTGIVQRLQKGGTAEIPIEKMVVFINDKEGDNWWGTSVLRPAYKHWYIKNQFYRIDAIAFERQGLGVPYAKLPENATEADRRKARELLQNLRAHHQAYIIEPHDYELGFKDMMAKSLRDPEKSIMHHNREIAKSVLAMFLELGATDSGSRALSEDQTEVFLMSLEGIAGNIADAINKYAIKQIVDLNFDGVEKYPELKWTGIQRTDAEKLATAYETLTRSGGIKADLQTDEQYLRELLGLPYREFEEGDDQKPIEKKDDPEDDNDDEDLEEVGMSEFAGQVKKKIYPERSEISRAITASLPPDPAEAIILLKQRIAFLDNRGSHREARFFSIVKGEMSRELAFQRRRAFAEGNDEFESPLKEFRRSLTLTEKKVDFKAIQRELDRLEEEFKQEATELLRDEQAKYIKKLNSALNRGDEAAIAQIKMTAQKKYQAIIFKFMKDAYRYGKNNAAKEIGEKAPADNAKTIAQIKVQAAAIADQHMADLDGEAKLKVTEALTKGETSTQAAAVAETAMTAKIVDMARNTAEIIMAGHINTGRYQVLEQYQEKIYAWQRSEILDTRTCNYCISIDGRIVEKDDPFRRNRIFHSGCRGIWVGILIDEEDLPPIGGIPKGLRDRFGDAVNDLIQPRKPQPGSRAAKKEVERRAKRDRE